MKTLTKAQRELLFATCVDGCRKGNWPSAFWRTFDQLERRGLIGQRFPATYYATEAGRTALASRSGEGGTDKAPSPNDQGEA